jgi:hypothetical protein
MTDRTTKILLASIALGLWANALIPLVQPISALAQYESDYILKSINAHLANMDVNLDKLQKGSCSNGKLCL